MNSTADLYTPDFPHGTPAGYDQGCRGAGACPNHADAEQQTCKEASARYQRDPDYKRLVKSGAPLEQLAAKEGAAPKPAPRPAIPEQQEVPSTPDAAELTDFPHGTVRGFRRGCTDENKCPRHPESGITCRDALRAYDRDWYKKRHQTSPGEGSAPTPDVPAKETQARETGGTTPAETEATIRTPEPSTVDHTPPTPDEPVLYSHGGEPDGDGNVFGKEPDWPLPPDDELTAPRTSSSWSRAKDNTILQAYIENAEHDAAHIKTLARDLEDTRRVLADADISSARHQHDWAHLYAAHETLKAERTIDTQLAKLIPALAADQALTGGDTALEVTPPAADLLVQPQADGSIRVALRGGSEPMRLHVGFQDGQTSTVSVSIGGN